MRDWSGVLLVDVSNVCRSISPPSWQVLNELLDAWRDEYGTPRETLLVADTSLRRLLPREPSFASLSDSHVDLRYVPKADDVILDLAHGLLEAGSEFAVISGDRFVPESDTHPWLIGDSAHFFEFLGGPNGRQITRRSMDMALQTRGQRRELILLKDRGFSGGPEDIRLARIYRCQTLDCWLRQWRPERLVGLPVVEPDGTVRCPGCGQSLLDAGPAPLRRRIVINSDLEKSFLLTAGIPITVGRSRDPQTQVLGLDQFDLPADLLAQISRTHLELALTDKGEVVVTNLRATNGTVLDRRGRRGASEELRTLKPNQTVRLRERDRVVLADVATLELSGERRPLTVALASG